MTTETDQQNLRNIILYLDQALHNHTIWYYQVIRALACNIKDHLQDLNTDADRTCSFGQWYYHAPKPELHLHPTFIALGDAHEYTHKLATKLLQEMINNQCVSEYDYDKFTNAIERLQLSIISLKQELEDSLYSRDQTTGAIEEQNIFPLLNKMKALAYDTSINSALAVLSIDSLKDIKENKREDVINEILTAIAKYLKSNLRGYDKIFRYDDNKFIICITNVDATTAHDKLENLRAGIRDTDIDILTDKIRVEVSMGASLFNRENSLEEDLNVAISALAQAEKDGGNRLIFNLKQRKE